jgi:hypothetical protein
MVCFLARLKSMHAGTNAVCNSLNGTTLLLSHSRHQRTCRLVAVVLCALNLSWAQSVADRPSVSSPASLADSLRRAGSTQLHILYLHGIGANGPDHDSQLLRANICKFLHCTAIAGQLEGTDYADKHVFTLNAPPPALKYLGEPVWKSDPSGASSEEWNASAPYVDHWKLVGKSGQVLYVDEINWWPLVIGLKCRQIVAKDASLIGPAVGYIDLCSKSQPAAETGRFLYYPWIEDPKQLKAGSPKGALINRSLKNSLLDWGFSDALLAVGTMQPLLLEGIRQLIIKSVNVAADGSRGASTGPQPSQEFVIVTHSLGSYLIFSALDLKSPQPDSAERQEWRKQFEHVLSHTPVVYFFANQLRLLELANLDADNAKGNMIHHLKTWSELRRNHMASLSGMSPNAVERA